MGDLNLIDFYRDCARALLHLLTQFPRPVELYVEDLIGPDHVDEFGLHSMRHQACLGALLWLEAEGYLRSQGVIRQEAIDQAILSARALTLLERIADTDTGAIRVSEQIRQTLTDGSSTQLSDVMRTFLNAGTQASPAR